MKSLSLIIVLTLIVDSLICYSKTTAKCEVVLEQKDSIVAIKRDSDMLADSIATIKQKKEETIANLCKRFRYKEDEFENITWVHHITTPQYVNYNSIYLYFQKDKDGKASNLRFRVQYEGKSWLFIKNMIFNIDGDNFQIFTSDMKRDCGAGGSIWEWYDESYNYREDLIERIAQAKVVKVKFNGSKYYNIKTMSPEEIQAFKETLEYYKALDGK